MNESNERICEWCGILFKPNKKAHRQKYCGKECQRQAHNANWRKRHKSYGKSPKAFAKDAMAQIQTGGLDRTLEEAKQKGLTFAQLQVQKTLKMIRDEY